MSGEQRRSDKIVDGPVSSLGYSVELRRMRWAGVVPYAGSDEIGCEFSGEILAAIVGSESLNFVRTGFFKESAEDLEAGK
jgi:hypothetical protein